MLKMSLASSLFYIVYRSVFQSTKFVLIACICCHFNSWICCQGTCPIRDNSLHLLRILAVSLPLVTIALYVVPLTYLPEAICFISAICFLHSPCCSKNSHRARKKIAFLPETKTDIAEKLSVPEM